MVKRIDGVAIEGTLALDMVQRQSRKPSARIIEFPCKSSEREYVERRNSGKMTALQSGITLVLGALFSLFVVLL